LKGRIIYDAGNTFIKFVAPRPISAFFINIEIKDIMEEIHNEKTRT
jgi:hypothetical protein